MFVAFAAVFVPFPKGRPLSDVRHRLSRVRHCGPQRDVSRTTPDTFRLKARLLKALLSVVLFIGMIWPRILSADDRGPIGGALERITIADLKRHCGTLASDALEGREAGATGGQAAAAYLRTELGKINGITAAGTAGWVQEFGSNYRNLIAVLPGSDPVLRREIILIGAHYDHVGRGNQTNSNGPFGQIHNGADDNASGTAALLELADAFASLKTAPRRTLVFAFWDAEEVGLLGSTHWVSRPTHPLKDVRLVVNIDMVGRLREGKVVVVGWRSAPGLRSRLVRQNPLGDLEFRYEPTVIGDSDHHPFYAAGIPSLHLDTGKHDDYHRPTDDADKLNYQGIRRLAELVFTVVHDAANEAELPMFRREALTEKPPAWLSPHPRTVSTARLGVAFEAVQFDQDRAVITEVTPGSAAARGGIRPGDRLLKVAHWDGGRVADLRTIVQVARNPVAVRLERSGSPTLIELQVDLSGEPVRVGIAWQNDGAIPEGVVITQVVAESPADRAGLKVGDVVLRMSGGALGTDDEFQRRLLGESSPLRLQVERNGRMSNVSVELFDPPREP